MLLISAVIWGSAFVAQSEGAKLVDTFTFNGVRYVLGGVVLLPVILIFQKLPQSNIRKTVSLKKTILYGAICGVLLFAASSFQQEGLNFTTAGKSGFITALYMIFVPIFGIFTGKKPNWLIWISVAIATFGMYLLCIKESFTLQYGDLLTLFCSLCFTLHILSLDRFSPKVNGVILSCVQFFTCGILSLIGMLLFETPNLSSILSAWLPILYAGVMSSGVAFTLQVIAQKDTDPTIASMVMSMESVFSAVFAWLLIQQTMTLREVFGCIVIFTAIVISQLAESPIVKNKLRRTHQV